MGKRREERRGEERRGAAERAGVGDDAVISLGRKLEQFCDSDRCQAHANSDQREIGREGREGGRSRSTFVENKFVSAANSGIYPSSAVTNNKCLRNHNE